MHLPSGVVETAPFMCLPQKAQQNSYSALRGRLSPVRFEGKTMRNCGHFARFQGFGQRIYVQLRLCGRAIGNRTLVRVSGACKSSHLRELKFCSGYFDFLLPLQRSVGQWPLSITWQIGSFSGCAEKTCATRKYSTTSSQRTRFSLGNSMSHTSLHAVLPKTYLARLASFLMKRFHAVLHDMEGRTSFSISSLLFLCFLRPFSPRFVALIGEGKKEGWR